MMTVEPNRYTASNVSHQLVTWRNYQFAVWYTLAGELRVGRIERGVQRWGVDHDEYQFAGAPRTVLALPVVQDDHYYPTVAVDGRGFVHVWANMHADSLRSVKTTAAHDTDGWLSTAGWTSAAADYPGTLTRNTYPTPITFEDESIWFYNRSGPTSSGAGACDSFFWTRTPLGTGWSAATMIFQGFNVPDGGGPGVVGSGPGGNVEQNWSCYPTFAVEPETGANPGRLHMMFIWRTLDAPPRGDCNPGYAYSDDKGVTWSAIDGTAATLPFTPFNNLACRLPRQTWIRSIARSGGLVFATVDHAGHGFEVGQSISIEMGVNSDASFNGTFTVGNVIGDGTQLAWGQAGPDVADGGVGVLGFDTLNAAGGVTVDPDGNPHILYSTAPTWHITHDGTTWVYDTLPTLLDGHVHQSAAVVAWVNGDLWMMKPAGSSGFRQYFPRAWNITGTAKSVQMGGQVSAFGGWEVMIDPEAWRRFGTVETLTPDGDRPRVFVFPHGVRVRDAA